jgi:hypothetical protein
VNKFAKEAGLDSVMTFMQAFIDMTETEFAGAIERMGATVSGLRVRFKNLVSTMLGLFVLKPSLDLLGGSISKIFDKIAESEKIQTISKEIGEGLKEIVEDLLGEMPSVEVIVSKIETALENVRDALAMFREGDLAGGLSALGVPQSFIDFIGKIQAFTTSEKFTTFLDNVNMAFGNLKEFWGTNGDTIKEALRIAVGDIADALGIKTPENMGGGFLKWTEDIDATQIVETIESITLAITDFITAVQNIPTIWEENKWVFAAIGAAFLALRYPILSATLAVGGLIALYWVELQKAWDAGMGIWWESVTTWFRDVFTPWLSGVASSIATVFAGGIMGQSGGAPTGFGQPASTTTSAPTSQNVTYYSFDVSASYGQTQSPAGISDDLAVLTSKLG